LHSALSHFSTQGFEVYTIVKARDNLNDTSNKAETREHFMKQVRSWFETDMSEHFFLSGNFCHRKFWKETALAGSESG